ncbi:Dyp-type peroxidase [Gordonia sp. ABSL1-1]|uniref:Dyp-type peroxidase n=1 Tax=Gordonia sp. ABSL1-1 TaxID=3053923 RepID=UPI002574484F|nr:Dyp-type peroxidase [Gordonia sp. ABSL1-1]MDL9938487.1 Dyp-type peroxidase [Gordonia sp. ABSL1-1]
MDDRRKRFDRRTLLTGAAGLAGLGVSVAAVGAGGRLPLPGPPGSEVTFGDETVGFHGERQAGVATTPQAHAAFVGLDLAPGVDATTLAGVLQVWTEDASRLTRGEPALADSEPELARIPARLTVTVALGPGAFDAAGRSAARPGWLRPLPAYAIDRLDDRWGQTDLLLQICADDPVTVAHATRVLCANVRGRIVLRWVQRGFRNARRSQDGSVTMRNLMGQVDGTVNPGSAEHDSLLFDDGGRQPWFGGGTGMVLRRIAMNLDSWQELDPPAQELTVGRSIATGAPLGGRHEHDVPDFTAVHDGLPVIPAGSHVARAHRRTDREQFLRRAYNYDDPPEPDADGVLPTSNSGLLFTAFARDLDEQYLPVQQRLAEHDALNEWTTPIGSAVYAVLPGARPGRPLGASLLER